MAPMTRPFFSTGAPANITNMMREKREPADIPLVGRAFARTLIPGASVDKLYSQYQNDEKIAATIKELEAKREFGRAQALRREFAKNLRRLKAERAATEKIRELRKVSDVQSQTRIARQFFKIYKDD